MKNFENILYTLYMSPQFTVTNSSHFYESNIRGFKSGASNRFLNRVYSDGLLTTDSIQAVNTYYNDTSFTWWINQADVQARNELEKSGYNLLISFPLMKWSIESINTVLPNNVQIKVAHENDLQEWAQIIAQVYKNSPEDVLQFNNYLEKNFPDSFKKYLLYVDDAVAATAFITSHDKVIYLHYVATLEQYRSKGFATLLCSYICNQAIDYASQVYLFSSAQGYPLYKKMGFEEVINCSVYQK